MCVCASVCVRVCVCECVCASVCVSVYVHVVVTLTYRRSHRTEEGLDDPFLGVPGSVGVEEVAVSTSGNIGSFFIASQSLFLLNNKIKQEKNEILRELRVNKMKVEDDEKMRIRRR